MMKHIVPIFQLRGQMGVIVATTALLSWLVFAWATHDDRAWLRAYSADSESALLSFVSAFPESPYVGAANAAIRDLRWDAARGDGSSEALADFLDSYPAGPYSTQLQVLFERDRQSVEPLLVAFP